MAQQDRLAYPNLGGPYEDDLNAPRGETEGWRMDRARPDLEYPLAATGVRANPDPSGVAHPGELELRYNLKKNQSMPPAPKSKPKKGGRRSGTRKSVPWKGWAKQKPSQKQRTAMAKRCPKKCFLGPENSFPVCKKNTCDVSSKGLWAAYVRSKQWGKKASSYKGKGHPTHKRFTYKKVANKAEGMLKRCGFKVGKTQKRK